jgi:hypothetical protein
MPKGDRLMADKQLLTGYAFTLQKTIGTDSKVATIQKLTDHALPVGTPPASIQRLVGYTLPAGAAAHLRSSAVVCLNTAVQFDETAANKLRVVKRGTKLQFFVNGTKQCEARADSDDRFRSIGFIASADRINSGADPGRYTSVNYLRVTGK